MTARVARPVAHLRIALMAVFAFAVAIRAQCCMWCPNGAGVNNNFNGVSDGASGAASAWKRMPASQVRAVSSGDVVFQASAKFLVPNPLSTNASTLTSTLYSVVTSTWGADTCDAISMLTYDFTQSAWMGQAVILLNGNTVASGTPFAATTIPETVGGIAVVPTGSYPGPIRVEVSSDSGMQWSDAQYDAGHTTPPDSSVWYLGWGWSAAPDCSVLPKGENIVVSEIQAINPSGTIIPLNLVTDSALESFCNLTGTVSNSDGWDTLTLTWQQ